MYSQEILRILPDGKKLVRAAALSGDTLPTDGIANGSACVLMDTSAVKFFDEAGGAWEEWGE